MTNIMKPQFLLFALLLAISLQLAAQVSISTDGSSPDPSSMLDVKSSNKGMLIPRVALTAINVAAPIASPAVGLLVYNTADAGTPPNNVTQGFYCWKGTRWFAVMMPQGTTTGDMLYWDGTQWVLVPAGDPAQILRLCNGVPTWGPCIPSVTTTPVSTITATSVVSGGNITNDGGEAVTARGVCWNTAGNPTTADTYTEDGSGTGAFASEVTGLSSGVVYYLRAYASNNTGTAYGDEIMTCTEGSDSQSCAGIPAFSYGGQTYHTVKIGTQCWLKENLNIGTMINSSQAMANNQVVEKYCYLNNPDSCQSFGGLYQWGEMMNYSTQPGSQGLCPSGWHLPADGEWCTLATYLDAAVDCQTMYLTGSDIGGKLKETGTAHWFPSNYAATNSSGFSAFGGGYSSSGGFDLIGHVGHWWTSSTAGESHQLWLLYRGSTFIGRYAHLPSYAFSVRCVKNPLPVITTSAVTDITTETASCGGEVVSDGGTTVIERGVCFNTTGAPTLDDPYSSAETNNSIFTCQMSGLDPNTTYYVRAYATTSNGTGYGNQVVFTTLQLVIPATAWELAGNSGTNPSSNFIGTTDTSSLIFKVNNYRSGMLDINRWNASWGYHALTKASGTSNTALGHYSLEQNTTGSSNTAVGGNSLVSNTTGHDNTAVGIGSMMVNASGYENSAFGSSALANNQIGIRNVALGNNALASSGGSYNTAVGFLAGYLGGSSNVFIGSYAGMNEYGNNKLVIDNRYRNDPQTTSEQALIYGSFADTPANQQLTFNANVGIGTTNPSNRLHIVSTANPLRLEGLQTTINEDFLVVDENGVVSKRTGTGTPAAWELTGNWGTNPAINFIGTKDYAPLTFRVHNEPSGIIDATYQNTAFGNLSFISNTTGAGNSALGYKALHSNTTGTENTATGINSLISNTEGSGNTANGTSALFYNTIGSSNTATGFVALRSNTVGEENCAVGYLSLFNNISGNSNTAIGCSSLSANTTGHSNVSIGVVALNANTTRSNLVAIGDSSLYNNGFGATETYHATQNTAVGSKSLYANTSGFYNTAMGFHALYSNTTGHRNTAVGDGALFNNSAGSSNTAVGFNSLANSSGDSNTGIGEFALTGNGTGYLNTAVGVLSMYSNTTGFWNTGIGGSALYSNSTGTHNTAIGVEALSTNSTGDHNTACGVMALNKNTTGTNNAANGASALWKNSTGSYNTANGAYSLNFNTTGAYNTASGAGSLYANITGNCNSASGYASLENNTEGSFNTANGMEALHLSVDGYSNTAIGSKALYTNVSGVGNVALGYYAGYFETGSNKLFIDSQERSNETEGREKSLIYGVFDADPANQVLALNANVGVGTITPEESSALEIKSTTKGFLPPRMTASEIAVIQDPADGLMVYNTTDSHLYIYITVDSIWKRVAFDSQTINPCLSFTVTHTVGSVAPMSKTVTYGTALTNLTGSDKCWITQNLGADHQATSVNDATEASAGWYWQFNRMQGYKHTGSERTPNTPWITNINENSNWTLANDPCSLELGSGWRLPTSTEWTSVDASGGWTNWNGPWNSVLKMHAAGSLSSGGSLFGRGSNGFYWSNSQYDNTQGWYLNFNSEAGGMLYSDKFYGLSARCLRE
jgi:uncharacterized protein (TIGR02145 family)